MAGDEAALPSARAVGNAVFLDHRRPDEYFAIGLKTADLAQTLAEQVNKAIREAVAAEREACAQLAETMYVSQTLSAKKEAGDMIATRIRARTR